MANTKKYISIRKARLHNLKNIDIDIPRNTFTVITGVSGSGKSSLAFDTIYAEGQRRFVESLSSYARQFLERMHKPDADSISGIPPAVAIGQNKLQKNPRSTVGTTTEIYDYLRVLYGRIGKVICHKCGKEVKKDTPENITLELYDLWDTGDKLFILFPLFGNSTEMEIELVRLREEGFYRLVDKKTFEIIDIENDGLPPRNKLKNMLILVDRLILKDTDEIKSRITDSLEQSFNFGDRKLAVYNLTINEIKFFSNIFECAECGIVYDEPEPRLFSFNNPHGACPNCQGFGMTTGIDDALVFPDLSKSINNDAIYPFRGEVFSKYKRQLIRIASFLNLNVNKPISKFTEEEYAILWNGAKGYLGLDKFFEMLENDKHKMHYRILLSKYRGYTTCKVCKGSRLNVSSRQTFVANNNIPDLIKMPLDKLLNHFQNIELSEYEQKVTGVLLEEIVWRLELLVDIGLSYLTINRLSHTLSGGEAQRIKLATALGSQLVGTLYVLDEPSIGLHSRDTQRLLKILYKLRNLGNTVIVVEHDPEIMAASENIIDVGPKAGSEGGHILYQGEYKGLLKVENSLTADYLSGRKTINISANTKIDKNSFMYVKRPRHNNLKMNEVKIPYNRFVVVTGVSGSGKSTLVHDIIFAGLKKNKGGYMGTVGSCEEMIGFDKFDYIEMVDQSPIGRSSRSTPATYTKVFDAIRDVFANTQEAKQLGWKTGHFSFNVQGGRCELCEGEGYIKVDMQFLPDVTLECEACNGTRYKKEVREVKYEGKSIVDVLDMTIDEAFEFFFENDRIRKKLDILKRVGLGYMKLGQPSTQLSGGEAQRIKLAQHLEAKDDSPTLFIFDEPTTGLHIDDISKLLSSLKRLTEKGHTVLVIEHNLHVIASADYIIDLGPEAGDEGGLVVAEGSPEEIAANKDTLTGQALSRFFG